MTRMRGSRGSATADHDEGGGGGRGGAAGRVRRSNRMSTQPQCFWPEARDVTSCAAPTVAPCSPALTELPPRGATLMSCRGDADSAANARNTSVTWKYTRGRTGLEGFCRPPPAGFVSARSYELCSAGVRELGDQV